MPSSLGASLGAAPTCHSLCAPRVVPGKRRVSERRGALGARQYRIIAATAGDRPRKASGSSERLWLFDGDGVGGEAGVLWAGNAGLVAEGGADEAKGDLAGGGGAEAPHAGVECAILHATLADDYGGG